MKKFLILVATLVATPVFGYVKPLYRDLKPATQKMVERQEFLNPLAASTTRVLSANAGNTSAAAASVTSFAAQPDMARNLTITPGGSTGDVAACTITVTGTDFNGGVISEGFTFAANASTAQTGNSAFLTVTNVAFPASCEDSPFAATWSVGIGERLGVKKCMAAAGHVFFSTLNGAQEATSPTMTNDVDDVEGNTADFNGTMNGSNDFELFFIQNNGC